MANEPTTPSRRTTRSSSATPSKSTHSPEHLNPPASSAGAGAGAGAGADLPFSPSGRNPVSFDDLVAALPGRRPQIVEILNLLGPSDSPALPILIYGGPSTGKTSSVLRIFHHLRRTFVYVSCRSCHSPRILFESVLDQLLHHRRDRENGYSSAKRCERASDFVNLLKDALVQAFSALRCGKGRSRLKKCQKGYGNGERIYLVFDNVELVRSWDKSSEILPLLFRLYDMLNMPDVGVIYISGMTPDSFYAMTGSMEPISVYFPDYTVDDLQRILMRNQENPKLYSCFLSAVLKPFYRVTRRVDELATALKPLFEKYCEPLSYTTLLPDEGMKRRLFDHLQPHLAASLNETLNVPLWSSSGAKKEGSFIKKANIRKLGGKDVSNELDFHMPVSAKYLLVSAFLASRNPATLDASLFDSTGGSNNRKRKRKSSQASMDLKDDMAEETLMKGPGSFPLERLLAIFQCITSVSELVPEEEHLGEPMASECSNVHLMSDVLLQLSTVCNANFLCKSGSCPLEGSTRYRSMIDEDLALKVARSINFPLSKYLFRR